MNQKLNSFLTLCQTMNYRMAAAALHLTQPAITKHIQSLEQEYDCRLFIYDGRTLTKTPQAEILESYAQSLRCNEEELLLAMHKKKQQTMRIGATRTIGDYVISPAISRYLSTHDEHLHAVIENTETLLHKLEENQLDFVLIEGVFDKSRYDFTLLRKEPFVGVCATTHPFAGQTLSLRELGGETLIVREHGSGTRDLFERDLSTHGYDISLFSRTVCANSFPLIKDLIADGCGISFAYRAIFTNDERLSPFFVNELTRTHEFHAVYLKNTSTRQVVNEFLSCL